MYMPRVKAWMVTTARLTLRKARLSLAMRYCFWQMMAARVSRSCSAYLGGETHEREREREI